MERPKSIGNEEKSILNLVDNGSELAEIFKDIDGLEEEKKISLLKKIINPEIVFVILKTHYLRRSKIIVLILD